MARHFGTARTLAVLFVLGTAPSVAAPFPVFPIPHDISRPLVHSVQNKKAPSRTETAKAWVTTKKNQTVRWVDRQKNKLKRLAD